MCNATLWYCVCVCVSYPCIPPLLKALCTWIKQLRSFLEKNFIVRNLLMAQQRSGFIPANNTCGCACRACFFFIVISVAAMGRSAIAPQRCWFFCLPPLLIRMLEFVSIESLAPFAALFPMVSQVAFLLQYTRGRLLRICVSLFSTQTPSQQYKHTQKSGNQSRQCSSRSWRFRFLLRSSFIPLININAILYLAFTKRCDGKLPKKEREKKRKTDCAIATEK